MTLAMRSAVRTHRGLVRGHNEDSAYAGPHLLAVADGVGGAVAGELASATVIGAIAPLDAERPADIEKALRDAVRVATRRLREATRRDPTLAGMGTTLTALLLAGDRLGLAHIADSRAYLSRDGEFAQITRDETLVQTLIDEGRLTRDEARRHPYRSVILRSLTGEDVDPVVSTREPRSGDRYLICSDGLTDYADPESVAAAMRLDDPDEAVERLIALALAGGGGDNVTCIVADITDSADGLPGSAEPVIVGAAVEVELPEVRRPRGRRAGTRRGGDHSASRFVPGSHRPGSDRPRQSDGPAAEADRTGGDVTLTDMRLRRHPAAGSDDAGSGGTGGDRTGDSDASGDTDGTGADEDAADGPGTRARAIASHRASPPPPTHTGRRITIIVIVVLLLAGGGYGGWRWTQTQYFVAAHGGTVAVYQGINTEVAGFHFYHPVRTSGYAVNDLVPVARSQVRDGISADSRAKAMSVYADIVGGQLLPTCPPGATTPPARSPARSSTPSTTAATATAGRECR